MHQHNALAVLMSAVLLSLMGCIGGEVTPFSPYSLYEGVCPAEGVPSTMLPLLPVYEPAIIEGWYTTGDGIWWNMGGIRSMSAEIGISPCAHALPDATYRVLVLE